MDSSSDNLRSFLQGRKLTPRPKSDVPIPDDEEEDGSDAALQFDTEGIEEELRHAGEEELNNAAFGIIRLDDEGIVQFYNRSESELSGVDPSEATGQNFFTELAPCSNNHLFLGRFRDGIQEGELDERFTYTFTYKMRPTLVDIRLYRDEAGQNWILIHER